MKIVDMPVARIKYFPEHLWMGKDVKAVATLEKELKSTREKFSKSRLVKEIKRETGLIKSVPKIPYKVDAYWQAMNVNQESRNQYRLMKNGCNYSSPTSLQMT